MRRLVAFRSCFPARRPFQSFFSRDVDRRGSRTCLTEIAEVSGKNVAMEKLGSK